MKKWKKLISIVLLGCMLVLSLTGCAKNKSEETGGNDTKTEKADDGSKGGDAGASDETVNIDALIVRWTTWSIDFLEEGFFKEVEEATNVDVNWTMYTNGDWGDQKGVLLASRDLPDVFWGSLCLTDEDIAKNSDLFLPLEDLIEEYMPNLKAALEEEPQLRSMITSSDGHIYSLPRKLPCRPVTADVAFINQKWLDNLGLPMPTTAEELYETFKAFKEQDANGNGDPNDEIPYSGSLVSAIDQYFVGILGAQMGRQGNYLGMVDGTPTFMPTTENYRNAVEYLHKMYAEGLLDQEIFTQDGSMYEAKKQNPEGSQVGMAFGWTADAQFGINAGDYTVLPPIVALDGEKYVDSDPDALNYGRRELVVAKSCENPEAVARWADQFYTNEAGIQTMYGSIGKCIEKKDDGTYEVLMPPDGVSSDLYSWENSPRDHGPKFVSSSFESKVFLPEDNGDGIKQRIDEISKGAAREAFPLVNYSLEQATEMSTLTTDIYSYVVQSFASWVVNGMTDADWDAYKEQLDRMGLPRLMEIHMEAFHAYQEAAK